MLHIILVQNEISKNEGDVFKFVKISFIILIAVAVIFLLLKAKRKNYFDNYEHKIIEMIKTNRIIDPIILEGLNSEDMKSAIRRKILQSTVKYGKTMDLEKMNILMEDLEFENLQKLYQWFFSIKADS